jgi:hypothetical protein
MRMMLVVVEMGTFGDMVSQEGPIIRTLRRGDTAGRVFLVRMLFVVISTDPVRERSYAIELGGR